MVAPFTTSGVRRCMWIVVPGAVDPESILSSSTKNNVEPYGKVVPGVASGVGVDDGRPRGSAGGGRAGAAGLSAATSSACSPIAASTFLAAPRTPALTA